MFEKIGGIKLQGGFFKAPKIFMPFHRPPREKGPDGLELEKRVCVIYGKNGSGKSSIASAIRQYINNSESNTSLDFLDNNKNILIKNEYYLKNSYVFNEDFINEKIRFTSDEKLNAIVLFGEEKDLDEKITNLKEEINRLNDTDFTESQNRLTFFNDSLNIISPIFHRSKVQQSLKERWAKREQEIKQTAVAARVENSFIDGLLGENINDVSIEYLYEKFQEDIKLFHSTKNQPSIEPQVPSINYPHDIDERISFLLNTVIKEPELNEREKIIFDIVQGQCDKKQMTNIKNSFSDPNLEYCPFCFQSVSEEYKTQVIRSIMNVFSSEEAQKHQQDIDNLNIYVAELDLNNYIELDDTLVREIYNKIGDYNTHRDKVISVLAQKKDNVYAIISNFQSNLISMLNEINSLLLKLEEKRQVINKAISTRSDLMQSLQKINYQLALLECKEHIENYHKQLKEQSGVVKINDECKMKISQLESDIKSLEAKKINIHLAIDIINGYLSYVFFSIDRLKVEIDEGKYSVKVRGEKIALNKLSEGEKNVIALCYFFSTLLADKKSDDFFKDNVFIVLDDPISSFDFTNKIGIYSFLRKMFENVFSKNLNSRVLILTHQVESVFHFEKVCSDLELEKSGIKINIKSWVLENQSLCNFSYKNHNEYSFLLNAIFDYANQQPDSDKFDETIGNIMRRTLEGFSTFNYKKGIEALSCNQDILLLIKCEKKREYFKNLMYRLVLNCESHLEYQAREIPNTDFLSYISQEEKIRTAKEILVFLNLINPLHIKYHLESSVRDYLTIVTDWENNLPI